MTHVIKLDRSSVFSPDEVRAVLEWAARGHAGQWRGDVKQLVPDSDLYSMAYWLGLIRHIEDGWLGLTPAGEAVLAELRE